MVKYLDIIDIRMLTRTCSTIYKWVAELMISYPRELTIKSKWINCEIHYSVFIGRPNRILTSLRYGYPPSDVYIHMNIIERKSFYVLIETHGLICTIAYYARKIDSRVMYNISTAPDIDSLILGKTSTYLNIDTYLVDVRYSRRVCHFGRYDKVVKLIKGEMYADTDVIQILSSEQLLQHIPL